MIGNLIQITLNSNLVRLHSEGQGTGSEEKYFKFQSGATAFADVFDMPTKIRSLNSNLVRLH